MSRKRTEHLTIAADENIIGMKTHGGRKNPVSLSERYWDEFAGWTVSPQRLRRFESLNSFSRAGVYLVILPSRSPISTQLGGDMFRDVCCPQCGNENPNAVKTKNYRAWEKETE